MSQTKKQTYVYFLQNGNLCKMPFDVIGYSGNLGNPDYSVVTGLMLKLYENNFAKLTEKTQTISVPNDSSLYINPGIQCAVDDVRKCYKIKRTVDTGDYNVIAKDKCTLNTAAKRMWHDLFVDEEGQKAYVCTNSYESTLKEISKKVGRTFTEISQSCYSIKLTALQEKILFDTVAKPLVLENQLTIKSANELTIDAIKLFLIAADGGRSRESFEKLSICLQSLNQTNWREYTGTLHAAHSIALAKVGTYYAVQRYPHKFPIPKAIQPILAELSSGSYSVYKSEKDWMLARELLCSVLDISKKTTYVSSVGKKTRLRLRNVEEPLFLQFFEDTSRLVLKDNPNTVSINASK